MRKPKGVDLNPITLEKYRLDLLLERLGNTSGLLLALSESAFSQMDPDDIQRAIRGVYHLNEGAYEQLRIMMGDDL